MVNLQDVKNAIDRLTPEERRELRQYLEQRESQERPPYNLSPDERARRLRAAFDELRAGLSQEQLDEITEAMNAEYIEPFDEDVWKD